MGAMGAFFSLKLLRALRWTPHCSGRTGLGVVKAHSVRGKECATNGRPERIEGPRTWDFLDYSLLHASQEARNACMGCVDCRRVVWLHSSTATVERFRCHRGGKWFVT